MESLYIIKYLGRSVINIKLQRKKQHIVMPSRTDFGHNKALTFFKEENTALEESNKTGLDVFTFCWQPLLE